MFLVSANFMMATDSVYLNLLALVLASLRRDIIPSTPHCVASLQPCFLFMQVRELIAYLSYQKLHSEQVKTQWRIYT